MVKSEFESGRVLKRVSVLRGVAREAQGGEAAEDLVVPVVRGKAVRVGLVDRVAAASADLEGRVVLVSEVLEDRGRGAASEAAWEIR